MFHRLAILAAVLVVRAACPLSAPAGPDPPPLWVGLFSRGDLGGWEERSFRGRTAYAPATVEGRRALMAVSTGAASGLFKEVSVDLGKRPWLHWSWRIKDTIAQADSRRRATDDCPARLFVIFGGGIMPDQGINYVWANRLPAGQSITAPAFSGRVKMIAVQSGAARAGRWLAQARDVAADYRRLFGGQPPRVTAVAVMTDTDDTGGQARAYYGDIYFSARPEPATAPPAGTAHASDPRPLGLFRPGQGGPLMSMLEITNRCNMSCPMCFSDANRPACDLSHAEIHRALDNLLAVTGGRPIQVQVSGGEPTVREDLPEIVSLISGRGFPFIEIISNGVRISQDLDYLKELKKRGVTGIYLQFDGLRPETHLALRGRDMTRVRAGALDNIRRAGMCCTLAVAVTKGVNDDEIGDIVNFGFENIDIVKVINFQTAARFAGRFDLDQAHTGYPLPELLRLIEAQTGVPAESFLGEHLGHGSCNAMTLAYQKEGRLESLFSYITREDVERFLGQGRTDKLLDLWLGKKAYYLKHLANPAAWRMIAKAAPIFGSNPLNVLKSKHILLFAKSFMERESLSPERVERCCYSLATPRGVYSFCAYNNLHRFPERAAS